MYILFYSNSRRKIVLESDWWRTLEQTIFLYSIGRTQQKSPRAGGNFESLFAAYILQ